MDHKIPKFALWLCALLFCTSARATWYQATITVTNAAGTTNGQTITVAGLVTDTRVWTNSVFVPATQILTNNSQAGAAADLLSQVSAYPFAGFQTMSAANGFTIRSNAAFNVTLSAGWGLVTWAPTNPVTSAVAVDVPLASYVPAQQTNVASAIAAMINSSANTNPITQSIISTNPVLWGPLFYGVSEFTNAGSATFITGGRIQTAQLVATNQNGTATTVTDTNIYTPALIVTNGNGTATTVTDTNVHTRTLIADGALTNTLGYSRITNAAGGHFLFQPAAGPITNSDDAAPFTNLPMVLSIDVPLCELFTNNVGDFMSLTPGNFGWMTNAGRGAVFTNAVTNCVRFRKSMPRDWDGGSIKAGVVAVCSGTNSAVATNGVFALRIAVLNQGTDLSLPTWGTLMRVTNNVGMGSWTNGAEAVTASFTIGGSPSAGCEILGELQGQGGDPAFTETNADLFIHQLRLYYRANTITNLPASSP